MNCGNSHFVFACKEGIYGFGNNSSLQLGMKVAH